jgi:hypothetical protein
MLGFGKMMEGANVSFLVPLPKVPVLASVLGPVLRAVWRLSPFQCVPNELFIKVWFWGYPGRVSVRARVRGCAEWCVGCVCLCVGANIIFWCF